MAQIPHLSRDQYQQARQAQQAPPAEAPRRAQPSPAADAAGSAQGPTIDVGDHPASRVAMPTPRAPRPDAQPPVTRQAAQGRAPQRAPQPAAGGDELAPLDEAFADFLEMVYHPDDGIFPECAIGMSFTMQDGEPTMEVTVLASLEEGDLTEDDILFREYVAVDVLGRGSLRAVQIAAKRWKRRLKEMEDAEDDFE